MQGVKLIFFSDSHLAPEFFKVVANSIIVQTGVIVVLVDANCLQLYVTLLF